jgi:hypothetical protein
MLRGHAEHVLLPLLPLHGACLDTLGGWADLSRGDLPGADCPTANGGCELALLLADDPTRTVPTRIVARAHAREAHCPGPALPPDDLTLPPAARRAAGLSDPWTSETLALHGLWADAVMQRAVLGDRDALDLAADLVLLDDGVRPAALAALGPEVPADASSGALAHALYESAGAPERAANAQPALAGLLPEAIDVLDFVTGSGDATHALLAEATAVSGFIHAAPTPSPDRAVDRAVDGVVDGAVDRAVDGAVDGVVDGAVDRAVDGAALDRLEAALFTPLQPGGPPGDVHYALLAGGGSPGATALAAELVWEGLSAQWVPATEGHNAGIRIGASDREWWLDGCSAARRVRPEDPTGVSVAPLHLALAERVGALLRAGDVPGARAVEAALHGMLPGALEWAPRLFASATPLDAPALPWILAEPRTLRGRSATKRGFRMPVAPPSAPTPAPVPASAIADAFAHDRTADALALAAWTSWRAQDIDLARRLLRSPPASPWARYAWRITAQALEEPGDKPMRPEGCPPPLWPGPV